MKEYPVTQYLRPNGQKRRMYASISDDAFNVATKIRALISAEVLTAGQIIIYARRETEPEESEISMFADNGPGKNDPNKVLERLIQKLEVNHEST